MGAMGFGLTVLFSLASGFAVACASQTGILGGFVVAVLEAMSAVWLAGVVLHHLNPWTLLFLHGILTGVALVLARPSWRLPLAMLRAWLPVPRWLWPLIAVAALETAWTVAQALVFPPYAWDALTYHLPAAALWVQQGYISQLDWNQIWVNVYPQDMELLMAWCFAFVRSQTLVQLVQLPFALAGAAATAALARQAGLGRSTAAFAGLAFYLAPIVLDQSGVPYVDLAFASLYLIAVVFAIERRPVWSGVALGLLAGVKTTGLGYAAAAVALSAALAPRGTRLRTVLAMAIPAGTLGCYWYLRTWAVYGNPVYPIAVPHLFRGEGSLAQLVETINTPAPFRGHPGYALFASWFEYGNVWAYDVRSAGFGPLWPILGLPAIPYFLAWGRWRAFQVASYLLAGFLIQPMHWWTRYTISFFALGAMAVASVLESDDWVLRRSVLAASLVLVLAGAGLGTVREPGLGPRRFLQALHMPREERLTRLGVHYGPEFQWLERVDPRGVRIAAVGVNFPYVLLGEHLQNRVSSSLAEAQFVMAPDNWRPPSGWRLFAKSPGWRVYVRSSAAERTSQAAPAARRTGSVRI